MRTTWILAAAGIVAVGAGTIAAADPATQPATRPVVVATVGSVQITNAQLDEMSARIGLPANVDPHIRKGMRQRMLAGLFHAELLHTYLEANKAVCDPADVDKLKKEVEKEAGKKNLTFKQWLDASGVTERQIVDSVRARKFMAAIATADKLDAFVKAHPSYFDGTQVRASHILIKSGATASTAEQQDAIKKLQGLAAEIKAGKLTFAAAATLHSACPSKAKGGDLGDFAFDQMVPPFAQAAFDTPVGQLSGIIRTQLGFHLVKVVSKTEGKGKPMAATRPSPRDMARVIIESQIETAIMDQALTACPIVIVYTK